MSVPSEAWLSHPEVQAIQARASQYRAQVYATTGLLPERFMVTEHEYRLLIRHLSPHDAPAPLSAPGQLRLLGMRVCKPERWPWHGDNRAMHHFQRSDMSPLPSPVPFHLSICRTERPTTLQADVPCPCGEITWVLATPGWDAVNHAILMRMMALGPMSPTGFDAALGRIMARMEQALTPTGQAVAPEPLPPLDELDEGLQCCNRQYATFAAFMAHRRARRQHGEREGP